MFCEVEGDEAGFEGLAEEGTAGGGGPVDAGLGGGYLKVCCVWDEVEEVEELSDWFVVRSCWLRCLIVSISHLASLSSLSVKLRVLILCYRPVLPDHLLA